jgi:hypothetical protein
MMRKMFGGSASQSLPIYVQNSTAGGGLGGLVFSSTGLVGEYRRKGSATWTSISLATMTLGTWVSGGWIADGALTGAYEVGIPNAALAAGVEWVEIRYYGAVGMAPVLIFIELDAVNYQSANQFITGVNLLAPPANWNLMSIDGSGRVTVGTNADKTGYAMSAAGWDAITGDAGQNMRQKMDLILAAVSAKLSGLPNGPIVVRNAGDTANRITVTFDANNNRTAVTYNPPA